MYHNKLFYNNKFVILLESVLEKFKYRQYENLILLSVLVISWAMSQ